MKTFHKNRLLKLAKHLEGKKLGQDNFDFSVVHEIDHPCGTSGCAMGELPHLFPRYFKYVTLGSSYYYEVLLKKNSQQETYVDVADFFGLTSDDMETEDGYFYASEVEHLFQPQEQCPEYYGGKILGNNAKPKDVAKNIRAFIKHKESK